MLYSYIKGLPLQNSFNVSLYATMGFEGLYFTVILFLTCQKDSCEKARLRTLTCSPCEIINPTTSAYKDSCSDDLAIETTVPSVFKLLISKRTESFIISPASKCSIKTTALNILTPHLIVWTFITYFSHFKLVSINYEFLNKYKGPICDIFHQSFNISSK